MISVVDFAQLYPDFAFDFDAAMRRQSRIFERDVLFKLPEELAPSYPYQKGGRGRPNRNQTRAHAQCAACRRVLRNDLFYTPPSMAKKNVIFSYCLECTQVQNAERYAVQSSSLQARRQAIWEYLAPACTVCGFDRHVCGMDLHHPAGRESLVADLITALALAPSAAKAEKTLAEARQCTALCSNCHRMLHAGVIQVSHATPDPAYRLAELMSLLLI